MLPIQFPLRSRKPSLEVRFFGFLVVTVILLAPGAEPSSAHQSSPPPETVAEAARNSRDLKKKSGHPHKIITNEDLAPHPPAPPPPDRRFLDSISYAQALPVAARNCDASSAATRLKSNIQDAQSELDSLRREAAVPQTLISGRDLDPQYFRPGASGLALGSPALLEDRAPIAPRVDAVSVEERMERLHKLLRTVCEPPAAARLQLELDTAEQDLDLASRALALHQADFYGRPGFTSDAPGQQRIQAEQQSVQELQGKVHRLKSELAALLAQNPAT